MPGALRLNFARGRIKALLPDTATVWRKTWMPDGGGGQTQTGEAPVVTVACRLDALAISARLGQETQQAGRVTATTVYQAFLPAGTDCGPADQLEVFERGVTSKGRLEVIDADSSRSDAAVMAVNLRQVV